MVGDITIPGEYWGAISQNKDDFVFPSPVNIPDWLDEAANWLGEGEPVLEKNMFRIAQFKSVIIPGELWHRVRSYQSKLYWIILLNKLELNQGSMR